MEGVKKILITDDEDIIFKGLYYLITLNFSDCVINKASSLNELGEHLSSSEYTHLILDVNLQDGNSIDVLPQITQQYPNLSILIHSMVSEKETIDKLMQFNIVGIVNKRSSEHEVLESLQNFLHQETE